SKETRNGSGRAECKPSVSVNVSGKQYTITATVPKVDVTTETSFQTSSTSPCASKPKSNQGKYGSLESPPDPLRGTGTVDPPNHLTGVSSKPSTKSSTSPDGQIQTTTTITERLTWDLERCSK